MKSGAMRQRNMMNGCAITAPISASWVIAKAAPSTVTMTLRKTSPYVRRTSAARSAPDRTWTAGAYEKPIKRPNSVGGRFREIYTGHGRRCRLGPAADAWVLLVLGAHGMRRHENRAVHRVHANDATGRPDLTLETTAERGFRHLGERNVGPDRAVDDG